MKSEVLDSFKTRAPLSVAGKRYEIFSLGALKSSGLDASRLPFSLKIFLENLLRREDGALVRKADIEALASWRGRPTGQSEVFFMPARVLMQDFTGVPAVVDLAAMREAMTRLGADAKKINPAIPVDLVVDHSVQVDAYGTAGAFATNAAIEFERNRERYSFLKWGQKAFRGFRVVPPEMASAIRSTSSTWPRSSGAARRAAQASPIPTPWSAPTRTRR